jgi:replication factor A1
MSNNEANAPHIEDIARVLGDTVDRDAIARELDEYLNVYRVPLGTAKESIVKKHGGNPQALTASVFRKLRELRPDEPSVDLLVRVVSANTKTIEVEGKQKDIVYGILGDDTGTLQFTAWDANRFGYERGEVLRIVSAYTKGWNDEVQVNLGDRAAISKEEEGSLPPPPTGAAAVSGGPIKVRDLRSGLRGLDLTFRVLSVDPRKVTVKGEEKTVWSGTLADESGMIEFSSWHDFGLSEGDVVHLQGGYIRTWRGVPQLSFDSRDEVETLAGDAMPPIEELAGENMVTVEDLEQRGGAHSVSVQGIVIEVREGSGLVFRCTECRRVVRKGTCAIHGKVDSTPDLRVKGVVDDGTGSLSVIIGRDITERLLGRTLEDCKALAQEAFDSEVVRDLLVDRLVARPVKVVGNVVSDDFGLMMIVRDVTDVEVDVKEEADKLLQEMGVN